MASERFLWPAPDGVVVDRRALPRTTTGLLAALAGCSTAAVLPDPGGTDPTTDDADDGCPTTAARQGDAVPPAEARIDVTNETGAERTAAVELVHVATPRCRYADPPCQMPASRTELVDRMLTVPPGATRSLPAVSLGLDRAARTVDTDEWTVRVGAERGSRRGLEAGAVETVGQDRADGYDWRVYPGDVRLDATLTTTGLELAVEPALEATAVEIPARTVEDAEKPCGADDAVYGPGPPERTTEETRQQRHHRGR